MLQFDTPVKTKRNPEFQIKTKDLFYYTVNNNM